MDPRPTIFDLARELGLSKTTVADALAGSGRVSARTRERVQAVAEARGYRSNRVARNLRKRSTGALGLYIPPAVRAATFYMEFAFGAVERASADSYDVTLFAQSGHREGGFTVDGAVVVDPLDDDELLTRLLASGVPVVTGGRVREPAPPHGELEIDHKGLAGPLFDAVRARGARQIAFIVPADFPSSWVDDMTDGYLEWCESVGQDPVLAPLPIPAANADLGVVIESVLARQGVDALVLGAEGWASLAKQFLLARGEVIGERLHLGTLSADSVTEAPDPDIVGVLLGAREFGIEAFDLLLEIVNGTAPRDARRTHEGALVMHPPTGRPGA